MRKALLLLAAALLTLLLLFVVPVASNMPAKRPSRAEDHEMRPDDRSLRKAPSTTDRHAEPSRDDAPRTELPEKPAGPPGLIAPPEFAATIFGEEEKQDPAWLGLQEQIKAAKETYSERGLAILEPLLRHPSARVRAETTDALLQMDLPAASDILRRAAREAQADAERRRLEQAANYNDLPSVDVQEMRDLIQPPARPPNGAP